jgi:hypothetical protein
LIDLLKTKAEALLVARSKSSFCCSHYLLVDCAATAWKA